MEEHKPASKLHHLKNALLRRFYYRNPLNVYLGQKVYGNDSGLLANLVGNFVQKKDSLLSRKKTFHSAFVSDVEHLKQKGWVRLDNIDFGDSLTQLRRKLDDYCAVNAIPDSRRLEATTIGESDKFFAQFPEVKFVLTASLKQFIEQYYQANFRVLNVHLYRIYPVPEQLNAQKNYRPYGATGCWHNDGSTVESIKLFVLIDGVDDTQGPMHVIGADETKPIIRQKYYRFTTDGLPGSEIEKQANVIKFTGKAGTVLFANPNTCLHRASIPLSGKSRDMLVFYLSSSSEPLPLDWEKEAVYSQSLGFTRIFNRFSMQQ